MAATTVLGAAGLCPPGSPFEGWVAFSEGRITEVGSGPAPRGAVDLGASLLVPGFVDLQANGLDEVDFANAGPAGWQQARETLARHGTTAFCPTFVTAPLDAYEQALTGARAAQDTTEAVPTVLGVHLEGPFLGGAPGAHPPDLVRPVDLAWLEKVMAAFPELVKIVTLAPEADNGLQATRMLSASGVVVALGHSTSSYDDARAAADAGATVVTHLFNGMGPMHHREPGLAGAALDDDRLVPTLIADLVHVHPAALRLALARKQRVALVSDVVGAIGEVDTSSGAPRLPDGTLLGATALLDRALANVVALGIPIERAVALVTSIPSDVLGVPDHGRLQSGARADVVALDPSSLAVRQTWIGGELAE